MGTELEKLERTLALVLSLRCWMPLQYKEGMYVVHITNYNALKPYFISCSLNFVIDIES